MNRLTALFVSLVAVILTLHVTPTSASILFLTDYGSGKVLAYNTVSNTTTQVATGLTNPLGIALGNDSDSNGQPDLVVNESGASDTIYRYDPISYATIGSTVTLGGTPNRQVAYSSANNAFYVGSTGSQTTAFDTAFGSPTAITTIAGNPLSSPYAVAAAPSGIIWIGDSNLYESNPTGSTLDGLAPGTGALKASGLAIHSLAVAADGTVYLTDAAASAGDRVKFWDGSLHTVADPGDVVDGSVYGIAIDPANGNLYVSNLGLGNVVSYDVSTDTWSTPLSGLTNPGYMTMLATPEPASASLLVTGVLLVLQRRSRRNRV